MNFNSDLNIRASLLIRKIIEKYELENEELKIIFNAISSESVNEIQIAAFLVGMTMKGETINEVETLVSLIKDSSIKIKPNVSEKIFDLCGTGGDSIKTFNISTASSIVLSSLDVKIAKHGNRSSSGICGSFDFLEEIGYNLDNSFENIKKSIETLNIGFLFAPKFHPILKKLTNIRKSIGIKTIFNQIGPLCNPCLNLSGQLIGVSDEKTFLLFQRLLSRFPAYNYILVKNDEGLDELSNTGYNTMCFIKNNHIATKRFKAEDYGLTNASIDDLIIKSKKESVIETIKALYGVASKPKIDVVVLNSAAALMLSDKVGSLDEGIKYAQKSIRKGYAKEKIRQIVKSYGNMEMLLSYEREL